MRKILLIILSVFFSYQCKGECSYETIITMFPSEYLIAPNSIFMIEISGHHADEIIQNLNGKYWVYLTSGKKVIPLIVSEKKSVRTVVAQAILKPQTKLIKGLEYNIVIENVKGTIRSEFPFSYRRQSDSPKKILKKYMVKEKEDNTTPLLQSVPYISDKIFIEYGCGDAEYVVFKTFVVDESEILVKATLTSLKSKENTSYYLRLNKNTLEVGHGMCFGPFMFLDGNYYEIEFEFFDSCGNSTKYGKKLYFEKPQRER